MKTHKYRITVVALLSAVGLGLHAGEKKTMYEDLPGAERMTVVMDREIMLENGSHKASLEDFAINMSDGKITQVFVSADSGVLGLGSSTVAVPAKLLQPGNIKRGPLLKVTPETLKNTPESDVDTWFDTKRKALIEKQRRVTPVTNSAITIPFRATELVGMEVMNLKDEKVGEVSDAIINLGSRRVVALEVNSSEWLGIEDHYTLVPTAAFSMMANAGDVLLDVDKDTLKKVPVYDPAQWRSSLTPDYVDGVYRSYGIDPKKGKINGGS